MGDQSQQSVFQSDDELRDDLRLMDHELEDKVLAAVLDEPNLWVQIRGLVSPDDFSQPDRAVIAEEMEHLVANMVRPNTEMLIRSLSDRGRLRKAGGRDNVLAIKSQRRGMGRTTWIDVPAWARRLGDYSIRRAIVNSLHQIEVMAYDMKVNVEDFTVELGKIMSASRREYASDYKPVSDLSQVKPLMEKWFRGEKGDAITTGYRSLDYLLGGIERKRMLVIGGRPGMMKSVLMQSIMMHVAKNVGPAACVSLEMARREWQVRALAMESGENALRAKQGRYKDDPEGQEQWREAMRRVERMDNLYIDDSPAQTAAEIELKAAMLALKAGSNIALLGLDYLELLKDAQNSKNQAVAVSSAFRRMKGLAKTLNCVTLVVSQLNRGVEKSDTKVPNSSHLMYGGEPAADYIVLNYYPWKYHQRGGLIIPQFMRDGVTVNHRHVAFVKDGMPYRNVFFLIVDKARDGMTGKVALEIKPESFQLIDHGGIMVRTEESYKEFEYDWGS
jgi:replicative DNA helicase